MFNYKKVAALKNEISALEKKQSDLRESLRQFIFESVGAFPGLFSYQHYFPGTDTLKDTLDNATTRMKTKREAKAEKERIAKVVREILASPTPSNPTAEPNKREYEDRV